MAGYAVTPGEALAALRDAHANGMAHPLRTLRAWARLAGVDATARVDLTTGHAGVVEVDGDAGATVSPPGSDAGRTGADSL